jgi:hypothetical protein
MEQRLCSMVWQCSLTFCKSPVGLSSRIKGKIRFFVYGEGGRRIRNTKLSPDVSAEVKFDTWVDGLGPVELQEDIDVPLGDPRQTSIWTGRTRVFNPCNEPIVPVLTSVMVTRR